MNPAIDHAAVLKAFSRALRREAHVLSRRPDLLWQQLYNRLQWENKDVEKVLEPGLKRHRSPEAGPWIRMYTPFQDSGAFIRTLIGHGNSVKSCAYSPDGRRIISASDDHTLRLWDAVTGKHLLTLDGHVESVNCCVFSPDGRTILSASTDKTLRVWDSTTGQTKCILKGHNHFVNVCAYSPDGRSIVSGGWNGKVIVWDALTGKPLHILEGHDKSVRACAFSPDGGMFASAGDDKVLRLWDTATGKSIRTLPGYNFEINAIAFSPDGCRLVTTDINLDLNSCEASDEIYGCLRILDFKSGKQQHFPIVMGILKAVVFSPDGRFILSTGDRNLFVWGCASNSLVQTLEGHTSEVIACAFSPDLSTILSANSDGTLRMWKFSPGQPAENCQKQSAILEVYGGAIVSDFKEGRIRILQPEKLWESPVKGVNMIMLDQCALSPDWQTLASARPLSNEVWIFDIGSGKLLHTLEAHSDAVVACAYSPNGELIVSASWDRTLRVWQAATGRRLHTLQGHTSGINACRFSPDGQFIVSASKDKTLRVWSADNGKLVHTLGGHTDEVSACVFSPDGRWIVSTSHDHTACLWDAVDGSLIHILTGHTRWVNACDFTPDGKYIVTGSNDKTVRVWDGATGGLLACLPLSGEIDALGMHSSSLQILCGESATMVHHLQISGVYYGRTIVTTWISQSGSLFSRKEKFACGCPHCRVWFEIQEAILGSEISCAGCNRILKVNPFTIRGDWQAVAKAWRDLD